MQAPVPKLWNPMRSLPVLVPAGLFVNSKTYCQLDWMYMPLGCISDQRVALAAECSRQLRGLIVATAIKNTPISKRPSGTVGLKQKVGSKKLRLYHSIVEIKRKNIK